MLPKFPKPKAGSNRKAGSSVTAHTYDPETGNLDVTFHGNRTYRYAGVPKDKAASFRDSTSQGSFVHNHLIGHHDVTEMKPKR